MSPLNFTHILTQAVDELSESESYKGLFHQHKDGEPLPSARVLCDVIELARSILFPGYFGKYPRQCPIDADWKKIFLWHW